MRRLNSLTSVGKVGTYTKFLARPAKREIIPCYSRGSRWGGCTLSKESPSVYLDQSSGLAVAHLGLYLLQYKSGEVPHLAGY